MIWFCFEPPPTPCFQEAGSESIPSTVADGCENDPDECQPSRPRVRVHGVLSGVPPCRMWVERRVQTSRHDGRWLNAPRVRNRSNGFAVVNRDEAMCSGISFPPRLSDGSAGLVKRCGLIIQAGCPIQGGVRTFGGFKQSLQRFQQFRGGTK